MANKDKLIRDLDEKVKAMVCHQLFARLLNCQDEDPNIIESWSCIWVWLPTLSQFLFLSRHH